MTRRKKPVTFEFDERSLAPADQAFYAGFTSAGVNRAAAARRLEKDIRAFMHHLPSDVMMQLHNAAWALETWADAEDARKLEPPA